MIQRRLTGIFAWRGVAPVLAATGLAAVCLAGSAAKAEPETVEYVRVCDAYGAGYFYIPGTETCLKVGGYVRYESAFVGDRLGTGTVVDPPNDYLFAKAASSLEGTGYGGLINFGFGGWQSQLEFGYLSASQTTDVTEPNGGNQIGYVPGSAMYGNGFNFGDYGFWAANEINYERYGATFRALRRYGDAPVDPRGQPTFGGGLVFSIDQFTLDNYGWLERTPDPNNVYVDIERKLDGWSFGLGPAFYANVPIGGGFFFNAGAEVQGVIQTSSFYSWETYCAGCGGTPTMISVEGNETSVGLRAGLRGSFGYEFDTGCVIDLTGGVDFGTYPTLDVRVNEFDKDTHIADQWGAQWKVALRMQRSF